MPRFIRQFAPSVAVLGAFSAAAFAQTPTPSSATPAKPKPSAPPAPAVKLPAGVVAQVNGKNITRDQLIATLDDLGGQPLIQQVITATLLEQEAKRLGVTITPAEIADGIKRAKESIVSSAMMTGQPMTFNEIAARDGITTGLLTWSVRNQLLMQKTYAKSIEKNTPLPTFAGQIRASHILIATNPLPGSAPDAKPVSDEDAKKKAESILADIKAGKVTFDAAARQFSDDKGSGALGGDLGWFSKERMVPEFANAAFALTKVGDLSEPVKSQFGYHLIRLTATPAQATASDKQTFRQRAIAERQQDPNGVRNWMNELTNKAKIVRSAATPATPTKKASPKTR